MDKKKIKKQKEFTEVEEDEEINQEKLQELLKQVETDSKNSKEQQIPELCLACGMIDHPDKVTLDPENPVILPDDEEGQETQLHMFLSLISIYGDIGKSNKVIQVLENMKSFDFQVPVEVFVAGIVSVGESNDLDKIEDILRLMETCGIGYSTMIFNAMITAYGNGDNIDECIQLFQMMQEEQNDAIKPDATTYTILLRICGNYVKENGKEPLRHMLAVLEDSKVEWDDSLHNIMVNVYQLLGDSEKSIAKYRELKEKNIPLQLEATSSILRISAEGKPNFELMEEVQQDIER
eukprot:CAMPEP_0206172994 /NCGR_PEP_ID=MMETSP1474-20131121/47366_1 /ASSEMBLY_ACC=CAM_ASM_001110 /TAXON_ID=97495 /ORGANISM="Imantonia sp., Strain RCC918" /LENGTH=292 /DNA_ID=CAMNT_0053581511 /DNA_START=429 /DNA_END=1304 /DNA_ORIENTATION=+